MIRPDPGGSINFVRARQPTPSCSNDHRQEHSLRLRHLRPESTPTFADATRQVWKQLQPGWRSPQHAQLWLSSLERYPG